LFSTEIAHADEIRLRYRQIDFDDDCRRFYVGMQDVVAQLVRADLAKTSTMEAKVAEIRRALTDALGRQPGKFLASSRSFILAARNRNLRYRQIDFDDDCRRFYVGMQDVVAQLAATSSSTMEAKVAEIRRALTDALGRQPGKFLASSRSAMPGLVRSGLPISRSGWPSPAPKGCAASRANGARSDRYTRGVGSAALGGRSTGRTGGA
jgi:hypothetical protein